MLQAYINFSYRFLRKTFGNKPFRLLDIGAGNQSASKITRVFPNCEYYGLDKTTDYNYNQSDFRIMKAFYEVDLTSLKFDHLPRQYFDVLWMVHVIEHLHNGDQVLPRLLNSLKCGGYFYIEYPGKKSTTLPSMRGSLNFYDDPTHVRVYSVRELREIFEQHNCRVISNGTRRNWIYITATPFRIIASLIKGKKLQGNIFWDILGFAEYLYVQKK